MIIRCCLVNSFVSALRILELVEVARHHYFVLDISTMKQIVQNIVRGRLVMLRLCVSVIDQNFPIIEPKTGS